MKFKIYSDILMMIKKNYVKSNNEFRIKNEYCLNLEHLKWCHFKNVSI